MSHHPAREAAIRFAAQRLVRSRARWTRQLWRVNACAGEGRSAQLRAWLPWLSMAWRLWQQTRNTSRSIK